MKLEIHYAGNGWAGLYVDGRLEQVGESYVAEEQALALAGVVVIQDDAFMRGQKGREGVAETLDAVAEYRFEREARKAKAARLREQALQMLAEANGLDGAS